MTRARLLRLGASALLAASAAFGAAAEETAAPRSDALVVGALYLDKQGFYGGVRKGIIEGAGNRGIRLLDNNSGADLAAESAFVDKLIGDGAKAVIMSPVSMEGSIPAVTRAVNAGIPVVCYNTCLTQEATHRLVGSFVTTDQYAFGRQLGEVAGDWAAGAGIRPKLAILNCDAFAACQQRKKGFLDGLRSRTDADIIADQPAPQEDIGQRVAGELLATYPDINMIWAAAEGGSIGAARAVSAGGGTRQVAVFGSDITRELAELVQEGTIVKAVIAQHPQEMGAQAIADALKLASGGKPDTEVTMIRTRVYTAADKAALAAWLLAHQDGIP